MHGHIIFKQKKQNKKKQTNQKQKQKQLGVHSLSQYVDT